MTGFDGFAGNKKTVGALRGLIAAGKLPHALLFEGEDGLGKFTLAGIVAAAVVCVGDDPPCGSCSGCHLAAVGSHPDIEVVEPDGKTIRVDTVREVIKRSVLMPNQAPRRVFIFRRAELLNEESQNALLKTLEEPPDTAVFILLASSASALLDTVVSRCVVFSLEPPETAEATAALEKLGFSGDDAENALLRTGGNIGRAAALLGEPDEKLPAAEFFSLVSANKTYEALLAVKKCDRASASALLERLYAIILNERRAAAFGKAASGLSENRLRSMSQAVSDAREMCERNANLNLLFNNLCLKLRG